MKFLLNYKKYNLILSASFLLQFNTWGKKRKIVEKEDGLKTVAVKKYKTDGVVAENP